ncbi:TlpA disulfide reductase family protein [Sphingobacterium faecale]|uniref:AhpC/TSA family protein n=1 Tax=Sphingobacterium faecale TaxID=2803775 RepID=A0ABS1R5Q3_9SPHI|nr:TlpA disulfide reductase family protein [Sphingobacterium faecale]MBL1410048.1 AhpC/TSA family protein [Sphingobacterium faecale]
MMKNLFVFCMALFCLSCLSAQELKCVIKGNIVDLDSPATVFMFVGKDVDSAKVENGQFEITSFKKEPTRAELIVIYGLEGRRSPQISVFLENGIILLKSDTSFSNIVIEGGILNNEFQFLHEKLKPFNLEIDRVFHSSSQLEMTDSLENRLLEEVERIEDKKNAIRLKWINSNPSSLISFFVLKDVAGFDPEPDKIISLFESLDYNIKQSSEGKAYLEFLMKLKATSLGAEATDFSRRDINGNVISLSDFKGKYVLLDFWGSWCGPCRASHPHLRDLHAEYKSKGLEIIGIASEGSNSERARKAWVDAINEDQIEWIHILNDEEKDKQDLVKTYSITAFPTKILLDKDGKIVYRGVGSGSELSDYLKNIFTTDLK